MLFMALAMLFTCVPQVSANLVAYYSFSGNANDTSSYGNNGLLVGGAVLPLTILAKRTVLII
jgi:hypothetical protein